MLPEQQSIMPRVERKRSPAIPGSGTDTQRAWRDHRRVESSSRISLASLREKWPGKQVCDVSAAHD